MSSVESLRLPAPKSPTLALALLERWPRPAALLHPGSAALQLSEAFRRAVAEVQGPSDPADLSRLLIEIATVGPPLSPRLMSLPRSSQRTGLNTRLLVSPLQGEPPWLLLELLDPQVSLQELRVLLQDPCRGPCCLMQFELQQLDLVRGTLGILAADALLDALVARLQTRMPADALFSRQGTDRLLLAFTTGRDDGALQAMAAALLEVLEAPISVAEHVIEPSFNVGISRAPLNGVAFAALLEASSQALQATHAPPFTSCELAYGFDRAQERRERLAQPLAEAIRQERLALAFQPIFELEGGRIVGAEVLCRWDDPEMGRQTPLEFIDVAEATQQIEALGHWVLDHALSQLCDWDRRGLQLERLGINISPLQLLEENWSGRLREMLARCGVAPERIALEIKEAGLKNPAEPLAAQMEALSGLGFPLALDDFGTGYAGLQRLSELPIRQVKVDRSLIHAVDYDPLQQALLSAVIDLAAARKIDVIVEGIERSRQRQMLLSLGCRLGQGYQMAAPLTSEELEALLTNQVAVPT
ncbi:MAG: EAL domain-containing protein [Synechococcaceae cyanobacterium]|nr:EAL domain-containing protein [Synechococcaceae cyanobacterium]